MLLRRQSVVTLLSLVTLSMHLRWDRRLVSQDAKFFQGVPWEKCALRAYVSSPMAPHPLQARLPPVWLDLQPYLLQKA